MSIAGYLAEQSLWISLKSHSASDGELQSARDLGACLLIEEDYLK